MVGTGSAVGVSAGVGVGSSVAAAMGSGIGTRTGLGVGTSVCVGNSVGIDVGKDVAVGTGSEVRLAAAAWVETGAAVSAGAAEITAGVEVAGAGATGAALVGAPAATVIGVNVSSGVCDAAGAVHPNRRRTAMSGETMNKTRRGSPTLTGFPLDPHYTPVSFTQVPLGIPWRAGPNPCSWWIASAVSLGREFWA